MNRPWMRRMHRSVFIGVGIFVAGWLLSGMLMVMPDDWFMIPPQRPDVAVDWRQVTLSPAAAASRAAGAHDNARQVSLTRVNGRPVYAVTLAGGKRVLVDAENGKSFEYTREQAEAVIRAAWKITAPLLDMERLQQHTLDYGWGSLPAWHARFADAPSANYYLSADDDRLYRSTPFSRIRRAIASVHEFEPLHLVTDNSSLRKALLLVVSAIALFGAVLGLLLTLPGARK